LHVALALRSSRPFGMIAGMAFGEMALLEPNRSADVVADAAATAFEVPLAEFERFRKAHPHASE
jgi:glutaminase